jgi:hypothetical protein
MRPFVNKTFCFLLALFVLAAIWPRRVATQQRNGPQGFAHAHPAPFDDRSQWYELVRNDVLNNYDDPNSTDPDSAALEEQARRFHERTPESLFRAMPTKSR